LLEQQHIVLTYENDANPRNEFEHQIQVLAGEGIVKMSANTADFQHGSSPVILDIHQISKSYQGVSALQGVSLQVRKGEIHALLGSNGAGKSTLIGILSGVTQPDSGEITLNSAPFSPKNPSDAIASGITTIYQELSLVPALTTLENIYLGRERMNQRTGMKFILDRKEMKKEVIELANMFGITTAELDIPISEFGALKKKVIEIVKALTFKTQVLILDEPTSGLEDDERFHLFDKMRQLKNRGVSLIWVTHHLEELHGLADVATVFRDGKSVGTLDLANATVDDIIEKMFGVNANEFRIAKKSHELTNEEFSYGEEVLNLNNVTRTGVIQNISFNLRAGEVLGISGLTGAGRTELARVIMGLDKHDAGEISVKGKVVKFKSSSVAYRSGLAMLPEDRKQLGIISGLTVAENISISNLSNVSKFGFFISRKKERELAVGFKDVLSIRTPSVDQIINNLSGGSQQKAIVARCLNTNPNILIIDEPTQGIDVVAKLEVHNLIRNFIAEGGAAIVIASEIEELLDLSHKVIIMRKGSIAGTIENISREKQSSHVEKIKSEVHSLSTGKSIKK
jgi:ABC-type sugar transport system ATPase subunit